MNFQGGYLTLGRVKGVPIRFHWTLPLGMAWLGGFAVRPGIWLGYLIVVLVHEAGHALLVRRYGLHVFGIDLHGLGGVCRHSPALHAKHDATIAWGGVLAQLVLYVVALLLSQVLPVTIWTRQLMVVLLSTNLWLVLLNLLPLPGFDGAKAWRLPMMWLRGERRIPDPRESWRRERDVTPPADVFPGRGRKASPEEPKESYEDLAARVQRIVKDAAKKQ